MGAEDYRERVTVRRPQPPTNDGGVAVPGTPATIYRRTPASVRNAAPGLMERIFGGQVQGIASHVVAFSRRAVLLTDEVVWHDVMNGVATDRVLRITGRAEDKAKDEVYLAVTELVQ